jgi:hypothetical protein
MTRGAYRRRDGAWIAHPGNGCMSFRQMPADLVKQYCRMANAHPAGQRPCVNELYNRILAEKAYINSLGMTPKQYDRHLRTRPAYEADPAAFDAMDKNAREAWIKTFGKPSAP